MWPFSSYPERSVQELEDVYDYIVVGGGTAGCVLASRLSEDESATVLLVERGGVQDSWIARVPLLSSHFASDGSRSRVWKSIPQERVNGRAFELAGGNSLGGSSKINAMLYTRGLPAEYNSWSQAGHKGWSYDEIQPYFVKSETDLDQNPESADAFHGVSGPWQNRSYKQNVWGHTTPIIEGAKALGVPYVDDLNSPLHPSHGCAKMHFNIDQRGYRSSTLTAFLPQSVASQRAQRLHICTRTSVLRIDVQKGEKDVSEARGIHIQALNGRSSSSGIGPQGHLEKHGIPVMKHLAGVGSHLQDHLGVPVQYRVPLRDSVVQLQVRPWLIIKELFLYLFFGLGILLAPVLELSIFLQSRLFDADFRTITPTKADEDASLPVNIPDIEVMPIAWSDIAASKVKGDGGLGFLVIPLRPNSKGTIRLASSDPRDDPVVDLNYLATDYDWTIMRQGIRFTMRLKEQISARGYPIRDYLVPPSESDSDVNEFIRRYAQTSYHYSSTCRMAPEDGGVHAGGVVDDRLQVHGVRGLRIADSSVFPHILSTHLAAATVAVAEKCADMIKEEHVSKVC
ncbi:GMC oxidoreductase [Laetiporus sulphureus 93-53]|uniref:GMC oxidoreductase n=1 Tax=Laetiporus sulphureus 93-53 TaxID=1314785 RepID=A0A165D9Q5_9APHY|nr:GMC oxidoreductase [Laetiporus sulphureus 93-53]KZT04394.1 GMC oxidoreductase [Laetiporus sulphureus 93-53]